MIVKLVSNQVIYNIINIIFHLLNSHTAFPLANGTSGSYSVLPLANGGPIGQWEKCPTRWTRSLLQLNPHGRWLSRFANPDEECKLLSGDGLHVGVGQR